MLSVIIFLSFPSIYNISLAVIQYYEVEADNEYVIRGNAAIMKCKIPSYISDFVSVDMWRDTDNNTFYSNASMAEGVQDFHLKHEKP